MLKQFSVLRVRHDHLGLLKSWAMGYLQQVGEALKTALIAAYLAGKVEIGVETCWLVLLQQSSGPESPIANEFSKNLKG